MRVHGKGGGAKYCPIKCFLIFTWPPWPGNISFSLLNKLADFLLVKKIRDFHLVHENTITLLTANILREKKNLHRVPWTNMFCRQDLSREPSIL